jgi:hypothetical protein
MVWGTAVVARLDQLGAEPEDFGLELGSGLARARAGTSGAGLQRLEAAWFEAFKELVDPAPRDLVVPVELGGAAVLQDDGIDDVATEGGHAPPPNLVVSTMSCDICPLCREFTHLTGHHVLFELAR